MEQSYKDKIIKYSLSIGFDKIGFANTEPFNEEKEVFMKWISEGRHGTLKYLERNVDERFEPNLILDGCKTAIVTVINYYNPVKEQYSDSNKGKISRYAWGKDYHKLIKLKLVQLADKIKELFPESTNMTFVDSGTLPEKLLAQRAGVGWQGKNSLILTREFGSWIFLGIILTTVDFEKDEPHRDLCGDCTKCLEGCPTSAIIKPGLVDATRCISYWTIETKSYVEIPLDIVSNSQSRIYGCDICQEVCPWNRFAKQTSESGFRVNNNATELSKDFIENLTNAEFKSIFNDRPLKRIKLKGLKRNVCMIRE
ncbi:MAG: tRNA epoxyqueuosine(34) reductase QueG [Ignavibacteriae bacterium]|nr:tRNA epoxyqueuosine(34) reductase QueG [Ignavibacteriota bacterium]